MPKLRKLCPDLEARNAVAKHILMNRTDQGLRQHDIAVALNLSDGATSQLMRNLDKLTADRIRMLVRFLDLNPVVMLRWLGYSDKQIKSINKEKE